MRTGTNKPAISSAGNTVAPGGTKFNGIFREKNQWCGKLALHMLYIVIFTCHDSNQNVQFMMFG